MTLLLALAAASPMWSASAEEAGPDQSPGPSVIAAEFTPRASADDAVFGAVPRIAAGDPASRSSLTR